MTFQHFYDLNGNPITGKSPVQIRVTGGKLEGAARAGVQAFLNSFLAKARVSLAENHQQSVRLADGTTIEASSRFGIVNVAVEVPVRKVEEDNPTDEFVGGILLRPEFCVDESVMFGPAQPDIFAGRSLVPEVATRGKTSSKPGRPAVPGVATTESTDWLVVQIAKGETLADQPVKSGAVKIYRLTNPLFGEQVEVNDTPERYLLSANFDLTEFYICGKRADYIPALPLTSTELSELREVRIRTYKFAPPTFVRGNKAEGYVFVAAGLKLFALNTRERPPAGMPTWKLLHTATFTPVEYLNAFGTTFTQAVTPSGAVTITCSGSNGAGVCSGFSVTITPVPNAPPTITGVLNPMHDGSVAPVPQVYTYNASLQMSGTVTFSTNPVTLTDFTYRGSFIHYTVDLSISEGANELRTNRFTGTPNPRYSAGARTEFTELTSATAFNNWVDATPFFLTNDDLVQETTTSGATSDARTTSITYTASNIYSEGVAMSQSSSYLRTTPSVVTALPADPVQRFDYDLEEHVGELAWKTEKWRTATRTPPGSESGSPLSGATDPLTPFHPTDASTATLESIAYSGLTLSTALVRRSGETLVGWSDAFSRFASRPTWADAFSEDMPAVPEKYSMIHYRTGPSFLDGSLSGTVVSFNEWFPAIEMSPAAFQNFDSGGFPTTSFGFPLIPNTSSGSPTTFSFDHNVDGTVNSYTIGDFTTLFPSCRYAYSPGPGSLTNVVVGITTGAQPPAQDTGGVADPKNQMRIGGNIRYDLRTQGFIAESIWWHEHSTGEWRTSAESFIGNDVSIVPLRQVLDEWRALGQLDGATDGKYIFAIKPSTPGVALL